MDTAVLEDLGLSNAEAKIYLALLELGMSKTGRIIDRTKLQSSTVYHVLGGLVEKGLVSYVLKGKVKFYQAENPETFASFLEEKKRIFQELLPSLKEKELLSRQRQTARVYEGMNGLKAAFNDILLSMKRGETYYFFQVPKQKLMEGNIMLFFKNYHLKRAAKGIMVKGLVLNESRKIVTDMFKGVKHTQLRFIKEFAPSGLIIYKDKLITLDWDDVPTAIVIQSKAVSDSYKQFFEEGWKKAK